MDRQQAHQQKVEAIARQVRDHAERGQPVHIAKGSEHHVVPLPNDPRFRNPPVDISSLCEILDIDPRARTCVAEPGVSFRQLAQATLEHGLLPFVVPELEGITIGGAVAGCSIEAMSYKVGGFHDNCLQYEIITGDGRVITCGPDEEPFIFNMIHGSYGTLGILSKITFRLTPAQPYVEMTYRHLSTFAAFRDEMHARCKAGEDDFIDGIIHSPGHFVLCLGNFRGQVPQTSDYRKTNIYYRSTARLQTDYLTTLDYCFRYDTECHWLTRTMPPLQWRPVRWALGRYLLGSTNLINWSNRLGRLLALKRRPEVVCDVFIPAGQFEAFFDWYERDFGFFPLWIVPYRLVEAYPWVARSHARSLMEQTADNLIIDCAVYGKANNKKDVDYSRLLEEKTYEHSGIKTLISRNHHTRERFWQIYNEANCNQAKSRLDPAGVFPDFFDTFGLVE